MAETEWTRELPTESGFYWFCLDYSDGIELLHVYEGPRGVMMTIAIGDGRGMALGQLRNMRCWWKHIPEPMYPAERPR